MKDLGASFHHAWLRMRAAGDGVDRRIFTARGMAAGERFAQPAAQPAVPFANFAYAYH
jgi:hypothetical protein